MKKISKKVLALLMCVAMLLSAFAGITATAAEDTSARETLLNAWGNLVYEKYTALATAKAEGTAPGIELVSSLPDDANLTSQEKALVGSTVVKFTGKGGVWTKVDMDVAEQIYYGNVSFDTTKVGIYTTFDQIELHALLGNNYNLPSGWNLVNKGFTVMELKDLKGLIEGLINGTIDAGGSSLSVICDYVSGGNGVIYVGSVMGVNYANETVPAAVNSMSDAELYNYAVANVKLDKYVDGVEEFEAALEALYAKENPEIATLINAWKNLEKEEYVTIAYPGGAKQGSPTKGESASLTMLTDEQRAMMGSHYWQMNSTSDMVWGITWENQADFSQYDSIFYVVYGTAGAVVTQINGGSEKYTSANSFTKIAVSPSTSWWTIQHHSYDWYTPIYIGSVVGHKTVKTTVPAEVYSMSEKELYDYVVANVNVADYTSGIEEFEAARDALYAKVYPEEAAVINAWKNLAKYDEGTVLVQANTSIANLPAELGLTDEQKAQMGTHYTYIKGAKSLVRQGTPKSLAGYDLITYSRYAVSNSNISVYLVNSAWSNVARAENWKDVPVGFSTIDATSAFANQTGLTEAYYDTNTATSEIYIGSVMGYKKVKSTVPAEAYTMKAKELYDYVVANVNTADYTSGIEEFETAVNALYASAYPEAAAVINAWKNLEKQEYVTIAYPGGVAGGNPTKGESSALTDLTDEQKAMMGSHYWAMNAYGDKVQSITWENKASIGECDSYFFVIYAPGGGYKGQIYTQFNGSGDKYNAANGFAKVSVNPSTSWWSILHSCTENYGTIYVGSVVGQKTAKADVPAEAYSMSEKELYDYVVANVNVADYTSGVEEFEAAINTLYVKAYPEAATLIDAWENLEKYDNGTVLVQANTSIANLPAELGLTDEQKAQMGTHYTYIKGAKSLVRQGTPKSLAGYDLITYSRYAVSNSNISVYLVNSAWSNVARAENWKDVPVGFSTIDATSAFANQTGLTEAYYDTNTATSEIYIGSIMGYKKIKETVPAEAYTMNAKELYDYVVANVNTADYIGGVEEFEAALNALYASAYPEAAAVVNAWKNLEKQEYITIAYSGGVAGGNPTKGESSALTALTDEQKAMMGSHYWAMNAYGDKVQSITWENKASIGECDSYFFVIYAPGGGYKGQIYTQFNGSGDMYNAANGFAKVSVNPSTSWWSILHSCTENYGTIYVGSVVGQKTVKATVPAEVYSMNEVELYDYIVANINADDYSTGVEEFKAALADLKEVADVIVNGDFEKGSVAGWNGDIAIDNAIANGSYSAKIDGVASYSANLKANETYMLTFKAYREDVANNFGISIVSGEGEVLYTTTSEFTSDVIGEFVEFKAVIKSNVNSAVVAITSNGAVWVDDFAVAKYEAVGDSNFDGEVDIIDLVRLQKYTLELLSNNKPAADANDDGLVNATDMVVLKKGIMASF